MDHSRSRNDDAENCEDEDIKESAQEEEEEEDDDDDDEKEQGGDEYYTDGNYPEEARERQIRDWEIKRGYR